MKVARAKLSEIGPEDVDMEEYKVRDQRAASDPSQCPNWEMGSMAWGCVASTVVTACLSAAAVCRRVLRDKEYSGNLSLEVCLQLAKLQ